MYQWCKMEVCFVEQRILRLNVPVLYIKEVSFVGVVLLFILYLGDVYENP